MPGLEPKEEGRSSETQHQYRARLSKAIFKHFVCTPRGGTVGKFNKAINIVHCEGAAPSPGRDDFDFGLILRVKLDETDQGAQRALLIAESELSQTRTPEVALIVVGSHVSGRWIKTAAGKGFRVRRNPELVFADKLVQYHGPLFSLRGPLDFIAPFFLEDEFPDPAGANTAVEDAIHHGIRLEMKAINDGLMI